jgi:ribosomal protein S27AE
MSSATAVNHPLVTATGEQCPSCGTTIAADQRYCLNCGQRCGEPRLPFMNAVTFMDVMKRPKTAAAAPPAANSKRWRVSPNTALIASVGTLILAMGVGVLIGRSSEHSVTSTPAAAQIIKVPAGGGAETTTASTHKAAGGDGANSKAKKQSAAALKKEATTQKGAEEVLKPSAGVKLPPATVKPGGSCSSGTAGCKGGEFTGEYFGE